MKNRRIIILLLIAIFLTGCTSFNVKNGNKKIKQKAISSEKKGRIYNVSGTKEFIIPDSDKRLINEDELMNYDKYTLFLAENEIFARKGYKFRNENLLQYFSNMSWYTPVDGITRSFNQLNSVEAKNYMLIDEKYNNFYNPNLTAAKEYKQVIKKDLNYDGTKETITAEFEKLKEASNYKYTVTLNFSGKDYTISGTAYNLQSKLMFADFNNEDGFTEFYLNDQGKDNSPETIVFHFSGQELKETLRMQGYVSDYDGKGNIFTNYSRTADENKLALSYYNLNEGVVNTPKDKLIGQTLKFNSKLVLFKSEVSPLRLGKPPYVSYAGAEDDKELKEKLDTAFSHDEIADIVSAGEELKIVDVDYEENKKGMPNSIKNIPIKVQTKSGVEGWLMGLNEAL